MVTAVSWLNWRVKHVKRHVVIFNELGGHFMFARIFPGKLPL